MPAMAYLCLDDRMQLFDMFIFFATFLIPGGSASLVGLEIALAILAILPNPPNRFQLIAPDTFQSKKPDMWVAMMYCSSWESFISINGYSLFA